MNKTEKITIPEELKTYINQSSIFLIAKISRLGSENISNQLYHLDNNKLFTRTINTEKPTGSSLFSSEKKEYSTVVGEDKYLQFVGYLETINKPELKCEYNTPGYLDVSDGMDKYIYIKTSQGEKWLYFEPESGDFIKQIENEFNNLFR